MSETQPAMDEPQPSGHAESRRWIDRLFPSAAEIAMASLIGGMLVALASAVDIATSVDATVGGSWLRVRHHAADALETVGLSVWLAAPAAALSSLGRRGPRWLGWLALLAAGTAAMYFLVGAQLDREASKALDGRWSGGLFVLFVGLCGAAVPGALVIGCAAARRRWPAALALVAGVVGVAGGHFVLRDDYPEVHVASAWVSMLLAGAALAPSALKRLGARRRPLVVLAALVAAVGVVWEPSNAVRVELFKQPGAAASYVLAKLLWRMPPVPRVAAPSTPKALSESTWNDALETIADDPVVVLVTVDALRADVVANLDPARFPTLSRLRDEGAYFANASATGSQTTVSLASMFTSRYFSQLRWDMYGEGWFRFSYPVHDPSLRFPALLDRAGVTATSHLPIIFLGDGRGVARGFTSEHVYAHGRAQAMSRTVIPQLLRQLAGARGPSFLYTHLMDCHAPYDQGRLKQGSDWERYLSEVEHVDVWLGRLLRTLRSRVPDRGYLILSADHGEAFGEHGTKYHSKTLYQEMIAVPLLLWGPGIAPRRVEARASLIDVGPTVMHLFRLRPPDAFMGQSLLPLARGLVADLPRLIVAEGRLRRASYHGDLKVIEDRVRKLVEVYDMRRDPDEAHNLFDSDDARVMAAVASQRAFFREHTLRSDGYVPPYRK